MNWLGLNRLFTNCFDKSMNFLESKEDMDLGFLFAGPIGMSLKEKDQVLLRFSSWRVRKNVTASDMQVVCYF